MSRKTLVNLGFVRQVTFGSLAQEKTRTVLINGTWKKAAGEGEGRREGEGWSGKKGRVGREGKGKREREWEVNERRGWESKEREGG